MQWYFWKIVRFQICDNRKEDISSCQHDGVPVHTAMKCFIEFGVEGLDSRELNTF